MFDTIHNNRKYKNLVNGHWIESTSETLDIISPLDGKVVGSVPAMSQSEVNVAIQSAKTAQAQWANVPIDQKTQILYKTASLLVEHADELAHILMFEVGKDLKSAKGEIIRTADLIRSTANHANVLTGESIVGDNYPGGVKNKMAFTARVPLGVVLAISPFNYPINLAASKIAPAILAGNAVVFKSATQGAVSAMCMVRCFEMAGVPAGILNTVTGYGREIGDYIVSHKDIAFINFTGSTPVGENIARLAGMKPLMMELGGKDAAIVLADADLAYTADQIVSGAYSYAGQRCTAVKRVLVDATVADELSRLIEEKVECLTWGNPAIDTVDVVPLIDEKSAIFVEALINDAIAKGGKLLIGGEREGNLVQPTLIDHVTTDMRLAWEEPFGPVLPIIRVQDVYEAIHIANQSEYGLQSSVFTKDIDKAFYVAERLEVGAVQINNKTERGPDTFPFTGVKGSGVGVQGIKYSIEAMTRIKATVLNRR